MIEQQSAVVGVGQRAPDFSLPSAQGGEVRLSDYRGERQVLLLFLHGMTCPFYRRHLAQDRLSYPEIKAHQAEVVAVTAATPDRAPVYQKLFNFVHPYLCNPDLSTARRYGLPESKTALMMGMVSNMMHPAVWREMLSPPGELQKERDESESHALGSGRMDGLFVIDRGGIVRYSRATLNAGLVPGLSEISRLLSDESGS